MNYYNEFNPWAAAWLRELIDDGMIPQGKVDERSIVDVEANDLHGFTQCHFFAGIGGWSHALKLAGWPDDRPVWTGSCPCQPFSTAGKNLGTADDRDLWPTFGELIARCRPQYVFGEQVENAIKHGWLDRVYADLEAQEYAVGAVVLGAHSVGAPHRRQRLYWGACSMAKNANGRGCGRWNNGDTPGTNGKRIEDRGSSWSVGMVHPEGAGREQARKCCAESAERTPRDGVDGGLLHHACHGRDAGRPEPNGRRIAARCHIDGMANDDEPGCKRFGREQQRIEGVSGTGSMADFSSFNYIFCRDGKIRRIPSESILFGMADGIPESVDANGIVGISEDGGFPLSTQKEGRVMLLHGYGNAIVPQVAAEFVRAFKDTVKTERQGK